MAFPNSHSLNTTSYCIILCGGFVSTGKPNIDILLSEIKYLGDISCTTIMRYHYLSNRSLNQLNRLIIQYCTWLISQNYLEATKSWIWWLHRSPDKIMIRFLIRFYLMAIFMADFSARKKDEKSLYILLQYLTKINDL